MHAHRSITYLLITALACIFLSGCIGRPSPPKTGSIIGTVKDAMSHTPLRGATVDAGPKRSATTGPNGTFTLSNVPAGRVILDASCPGYRPRQVNVTVPAGNSINCEIELYPNTSGPATVRGCATVANNYYPEEDQSNHVLSAKTASRSLSAFQKAPLGQQPAPETEADTIQVKVRPGTDRDELAHNLLQAGYEIVDELPLTGIILIRPMQRTARFLVESEAATLDSIDGVDWAYPDYPVYAAAVPNDPLYLYQWHYPAISLPEAWDIATGEGSPVIVAVIDTGIRPEHEDLQGKIVAGWDFIDKDSDPTDWPNSTKKYSHGTHVSGTIAAATNNGVGVAGLSWGAQIMPIRVLGPDGKGSSSNVAEAIIWAVNSGADVINLSLGLANHPGSAMEDAVRYAFSRGVTMVAAAGNDSGAPVLYPAAFPEVIAVSATGQNNELASYSSYGPEITVAAPGGTALFPVLSTGYSSANPAPNKYFLSQGTSMATPHVSGIAALLIATHGRMSPASIAELISATSMDLGPDGRDHEFGAGLVNAYAALVGATIDRAVFAIKDNAGKWITDSVQGTRDRTFTIFSAPAGDHVLVGFLDVDGNGLISKGDFYGEAPITIPIAGTVYPPRLVLNYVDGATATKRFTTSSRLP